MQNYQNFIDELFRLDIDTIQYFVRDGKVLYPRKHPAQPHHYPADTPADLLPGHVATFMSLDRYDRDQLENRYANTLVELQKRAITDLLLVEPAQKNRLLSDAKSKCESLTRLLKNATEYQRAWVLDPLSTLSGGFLELQLLDAFTIKSRPQASPHVYFAKHLVDAIVCKRGALSGFIGQIESTQHPALVSPSDTAQEPEYDLWYVNNDDNYRSTKLKELAHYLPTIEPFTKRVEWFFEKSRIFDITPVTIAIGGYAIPEPDNSPGSDNEIMYWSIGYKNDEERGILHKLFFLRIYRTVLTHFFGRPCFNFDQLVSQYNTNAQNERSKRLRMEWVGSQISDAQQHINQCIEGERAIYVNAGVKWQLQNAATLIEQELEGIPAIKWQSFTNNKQLQPFGLLWGLVEYKRFLETEPQPAPATTPPPASDSNATVSIRILPDARPTLINNLLPYVDPAQHDSLRALINDDFEPEQPIVCQCKQVRLGEIFYEFVKAEAPKDRQIQSGKTELVKWICQHFRRIQSGKVKEPTESVISNYLKGTGFAQYR